MYYDATYILVIVGFFLCLIASARVKLTFNKYSKVRSKTGLTGAQAAQKMLIEAGIPEVQVFHVPGNLTDHYDPRTNAVYLSDSVYASTSVAAVGVACHECGHAIQHATGYKPVDVRSALVPVANIGSQLAWPIVFFGLLFHGSMSLLLIEIGILLYAGAVLFQLVTLPVEFNASHRALLHIEQYGFLDDEELRKSRKVLKAAALTYVASAAAAILQLLRLILLRGGRSRD